MTSTLAQHATLLLDDHYGTYVSKPVGIADGQVPTYHAADGTWIPGSGGGLQLDTVVTKTTTYTAVAGNYVLADTSGGGWTLTLPASPTMGQQVGVKKTTSDTNVLTISPNVDGSALTLGTQNHSVVVEYDGTAWRAKSGHYPKSALVLANQPTTTQTVQGPVRFFIAPDDGTLTDLQPGGFGTVGAPHAAAPLTIPTYDGSNLYVVEPSVVFVHEGWNGYKFWMCMCPYPGANQAFENASIVASNDGQTWVVPPGVTNPLIPHPSGANNFDPTLFLDRDGTMYIVNQVNGASAITQLIWSTDGVNWTSPVTILGPSSTIALCNTPCIVWDNAHSEYRMYRINLSGTPVLEYHTASSPKGPWTGPTATNMSGNFLGGTVAPDHHNMTIFGGKYYAVVADANKALWLSSSWDGVTWTTGSLIMQGKTGAWDANIYRTAFLIMRGPAGMALALWYGGKDAGSNYSVGFTTATLAGLFPSGNGKQQVDSTFQVVDVSGNNLVRAAMATAWTDVLAADLLQLGSNAAVIDGVSAAILDRLMVNAKALQVAPGNKANTPPPNANAIIELFDSSNVQRLKVRTDGILDRSPTQSTVTGTTAGTAVVTAPEVGSTYKRSLVRLEGYQNSTATAQNLNFGTTYTKTPCIVHDDTSGGITVNTIRIILPTSMGAPVTGWIIVEGY